MGDVRVSIRHPVSHDSQPPHASAPRPALDASRCAPRPRPRTPTRSLPVQPATKRITSKPQLEQFLNSPAAKRFVAFLLSLNDSVKGMSNSTRVELSPLCVSLVDLLRTIGSYVDEIPPVSHSLRYGNPAFRDFHARIQARVPDLVAGVLPPPMRGAAAELSPYLLDAFGNGTRIDYGTGHETNFLAFLFCLARLGLLEASDRRAAVLAVFSEYIRLVRRVQTTYWLEPAGSAGVWGLDDYQFLTFLFGAAQLVDHPILQPASIHKDALLAEFGGEFMYLDSVRFVKSVKKGNLSETSPMLNDISGVPSWSKVRWNPSPPGRSPSPFSSFRPRSLSPGLTIPHSSLSHSALFADQHGVDQDVSGGGVGQISHHAALPFRLPPRLVSHLTRRSKHNPHSASFEYPSDAGRGARLNEANEANAPLRSPPQLTSASWSV